MSSSSSKKYIYSLLKRDVRKKCNKKLVKPIKYSPVLRSAFSVGGQKIRTLEVQMKEKKRISRHFWVVVYSIFTGIHFFPLLLVCGSAIVLFCLHVNAK